MAARAKADQTKSTAGRASRRSTSAAKKPGAAELRRERDLLAKKLKAAETRIAELEKLQEEAVNRIDWVIDSLQNALSESR